MSKRSIGTLYVLSIVIILIATFITFSILPDYVHWSRQLASNNAQLIQDQSASDPLSDNSQAVDDDTRNVSFDQSRVNRDETELTFSILFLALGWILGMIVWIGTLINLSRVQAWPWFALTLFFGGMMILIYLIGGPESLKAGQNPPTRLVYTPPDPYAGVSPQQPASLSALEILRQRYARGEIDTTTYEQMRHLLKE